VKFVVDKPLVKLGLLMQQKGLDCKIIGDLDKAASTEQAYQIAQSEGRVFLTQNSSYFLEKKDVSRGLLHHLASPFHQLRAIINFFT
jgi:uncharacterized protein with PIN domain